jgi:hypothetical protein
LLLAVAAVIHAAPPSAVAFAGVDKIHAAIRSPALPDPFPVDFNQQLLDGKGAGIEWNVGRKWLRPSVADQPTR